MKDQILVIAHYYFHAGTGQTLDQKTHHGGVLKGENRHILKSFVSTL